MTSLFSQGGTFMWPMTILVLVIVILAVKKSVELFLKTGTDRIQLESGINAIIFWAGVNLVLGFLAHFSGVFLAMQEIMRARDISPAIVAMGYSQSLITILYGMTIFVFSAIIWFVLRWKFKKVISATP